MIELILQIFQIKKYTDFALLENFSKSFFFQLWTWKSILSYTVWNTEGDLDQKIIITFAKTETLKCCFSLKTKAKWRFYLFDFPYIFLNLCLSSFGKANYTWYQRQRKIPTKNITTYNYLTLWNKKMIKFIYKITNENVI